jgi:hypothetical protein
MRFRTRLAVVVIGTAIAALAIYSRAPKAQPTLSLPFATVTAGVTTSTQIIGANPSRRSIQICNPSAATVFALPVGAGTPAAANGIPIPTLTCFTPPPLTSSGTTGGAGAAWNGFAGSSTNFVVLEW